MYINLKNQMFGELIINNNNNNNNNNGVRILTNIYMPTVLYKSFRPPRCWFLVLKKS